MRDFLGQAAAYGGVLLWWAGCGVILHHADRASVPTIGQVVIFISLVFAAPIGAAVLWARHLARRAAASRRNLPNVTRRIVARMRRAAEPTLLLTPAKSPGFSKLGGLPELPSGLVWPQGEKEPRTFVVQIDLAAVAASSAFDWLPAAGRLYLFLDDWRAGFADYGLTLFTEELVAGERSPPAKPSKLFKERRAAFLQMETMPSLDWLGVDVTDVEVSDDELDQIAGLPDEPFGDEIQHRIGGYPSEIQESQMQIECELLRRGLSDTPQAEASDAVRRASKQWRMLMQIDDDPDLGMEWGDAGRLYVFVRKADAARSDFSKTITLWQTH